jgi:hypothetical protein
MKIRILFILVFGLLAVQSAASQTVAYSLNDTQLFTVRMPDGWKFESKPNPRNPASKRISGTAPNGLVWFGVWVIKDVKTIDQAYKYVQATARTLITDAKETKPAYMGEVNGVKAKYSEHTGTMKMQDGKSLVFNAQVVLFETASGRIGIAVCMADTEGLKAEKGNIDAFFKSLAIPIAARAGANGIAAAYQLQENFAQPTANDNEDNANRSKAGKAAVGPRVALPQDDYYDRRREYWDRRVERRLERREEYLDEQTLDDKDADAKDSQDSKSAKDKNSKDAVDDEDYADDDVDKEIERRREYWRKRLDRDW